MSQSQARVKDRISALSDELICRILSCLDDTQCAVKTTVVSPRWKNLWTSLPNLHFCYDKTEYMREDAFLTFVDRVLFFRDSSDIKLFYLNLECPDVNYFSRFESWICTAIRRNVVELDLNVFVFPDSTFELPPSLFTSKTLEVLRLRSNFIVNPPKSGCFPCLKVLDVYLHYPDRYDSSLERIFSNCPVLEDLRIEGSIYIEWLCEDPSLKFTISAPQLKRMTLKLELDGSKEDYGNVMTVMFYINAPKLEDFNINKGVLSIVSCDFDAKYLFEANSDDNFRRHLDGTNGLLEAIINAKHLSLSTSDSENAVPAFHNLYHLELALLNFTCWGYLIDFLKRSRNLSYLVIKIKRKT
ncbi:F-box/FBD/LRR-repeat protein At4g26340-like isoform X1 [Argentina anserina]|uniref:F-box/FBD/LRR-repeat protein At4g26340-like isoform X1 n=1 Tax=Argentina anserina TaxID=57926 RepID=UPI002176275E|nr:F-box/FBD/LRR-repeat protein At4g26340-like isoform X1 [Potentilla anserina]XP_050370381.1 F-box/FBD/LRR-repeat protein At4g26340-like isoform X1 [Potentilla anserina]XP_050370382.1 F-box/FBD/LRR-repeat protein At4g26340-like isoform X1 [Potentilla anserina]